MSASLSRAEAPEQARFSGASVLLTWVTPSVFPLDRVLAGMVQAGQGIKAICLFLGLPKALLDQSLIRLGLRSPHDRPLRKSGARGWSVLDVMRLIAWRVAGVHPETIGQRLGRSTNAVRSKSRRLGVPTPNRKDLRRVDPATLLDPGPFDLGLNDWSVTAAPQPWQQPVQSASMSGFNANPASRVVVLRPVPPLVDEKPVRKASSTPSSKRARAGSTTQRELQLFRVIGSDHPAPSSTQAKAPAPIKSPSAAAPTTPSTASPVAVAGAVTVSSPSEIAWIGRSKRIGSNEQAIRALSMRYFGGQHWTRIAEDAGMTEAALRSVLSRADLPRDLDRKRFGPVADPEMAQATLDGSGFRLERDKITGLVFWKHKNDRGITTSRATRFRNGILSEFDKYKVETITLVTRGDLDALDLDGTDDDDADDFFERAARRRLSRAPFAERRATLAP